MGHDDFATEAVPGLPERPPEGEHILWQGRPDWWALTKEALSFWWVMGYFALLAGWRFVSVLGEMSTLQAFAAALPFLGLAAVVALLLILTAVIQSRATLYTVTNRRIAMRIGAALTLTLNLPYTQIARADLALKPSGTGTIALKTLGPTRISYLVCWPHVRPWRFQTQPALRCIKDAERVAGIVADAAATRIETPQISLKPMAPTAVAAE